ncbi:MAG: metallophosphatase family protein [Kiritimatiellae bacterium]|nr:metallophosphatase family protein [Kiritimatiellia bacterium]
MRIAIISDIHSNRPALDAVLKALDEASPDQVIVAGDVINRGPEPRTCLEMILELQRTRHWLPIKGNHEDFVLKEAAHRTEKPDWERKLFEHTIWTMDRVRDLLPAVMDWPDRLSFSSPDESEVRFVHASMRGNRRGLYEEMHDTQLAELTAPAPAVLIVGHTHIPFIRRVNGTLIVNAGAVGLPFDGITQASFALLDWKDSQWQPQIVRLDYDLNAAEAAFFETGFMEEAGIMAPLILDELRQARPRLGLWHRCYEARVAAGEISIEETVEEFLRQIGARPAVTRS